MVDITHKNNTLRIATAQAIVRVSDAKTIEAIENNLVPKGNVFEMSRAAGLLGIKKTPDLLPDCHPLPIEYAHISYLIEGLEIKISVCVKTIYKTGVEVEAMHGASIVALNMYDMLKPVDKGVEIFHIKLLEKKGGKSDFKSGKEKIDAAVIVCSDSIAEGKNEDYAGKKIIKLLEKYGVRTSDYKVIADDKILIENEVQEMVQKSIPLIIFTGGTGLSPRDNTPEALQPLLEKHIPGIEEAIRNYGQNRTQFAMLSRSLAGMIGGSLVLALPGSVKGAEESIHAIFPAVLHVFDIIKGAKH